eukprot:jgi/Undpi1/11552/HiC_scaffold_30.g13849.m1
MGAGPCCGFCYICAEDDAQKDSFIDDYRDDTKKASKWCVDDSASERVFIPDVTVRQVRSRRAHIVKPMDGWASMSTESGYVIMEAIMRPTKYKVVFREGIFVRGSPSIEEGRIVRIAPFGTVLNATGRTEIFDAIERVQVEDGWVSMRMREDAGTGVPLLMPLN